MPLHDSDFKRLAKLDSIQWAPYENLYPGLSVFVKAGNRMGTARRCNLARLFFTFQQDQWSYSDATHLEVAQILIRVSESIITSLTHLNLPTKSTDLHTRPRFLDHFRFARKHARQIIKGSSDNPLPLILPDDYIEELRRAGLLKGMAGYNRFIPRISGEVNVLY